MPEMPPASVLTGPGNPIPRVGGGIDHGCWRDFFDPLAFLDLSGRCLESNAAFRALWIPEGDSFDGNTSSGRMHPADFQQWRDTLRKAGEAMEPQTVDFRVREGDGAWQVMEFRLKALREPAGTRVLAIGRDVTAARDAEIKARREAEVLRDLVDSLPINVVRKDRLGRFIFANQRFAQTLGQSLEGILGKSDADFFPPDLVARYREDDRRVQFERAPLKRVEPLRTPAGNQNFVEVIKTPLSGPDGIPSGTQALFWDVTERELAQQGLFRSYLETEALFASICAVLIGVDSGGRVKRWNRAAEVILGLPASQAIGHPFFDCPIHWDWGRVRQAVVDCRVHRNATEATQVVLRGNDGKERFLNLLVSLEEPTDPSTSAFTLLATDITQHRLLEAQLRQAQKLESIGELAAGIAHEINTPTQFIGDNLRFLRDSFATLEPLMAAAVSPPDGGGESSARREQDYLCREIPLAIVQALDGVERVAGIVGAMKAFSHPDGDEREVVDLNQGIRDTVTVARNEWKYVAELVLSLDPALPPVPCYPGNINQVVLNLIVNAAHAISEVPSVKAGGRGTIEVGTRCRGDSVEIWVRDSGVGIPAEIHGRLFDPFFTTKPVGRGTGQGLFIAHKVVVGKHGGTLRFETGLGRGTTFIVGLPLHPEPQGKRTA